MTIISIQRCCSSTSVSALVVIYTAALILAGQLQADDWPKWRGPQANGISRETDWNIDWAKRLPVVSWRKEVGTGYSNVVVMAERLYTIGNRDNVDTVVCLDVATGNQVWSHSYTSPLDARFFSGGPTSTPTIHGDKLFTIGRQGQVFCFQRLTGKILWSIDLTKVGKVPPPGWGFAGSPVVWKDLLLLNGGGYGVALKHQSGALAWTSEGREAGYTTPVLCRLGSHDVGLFTSGKFLSVVDPRNGKRLWAYRWLTRFGCNASDPIPVGEQRIFLSSGYNRGSVLLKSGPKDATVVWKNKALQNHFSSSILDQDHLYGIDGNNDATVQLKCLRVEDGKVVWQRPLKAMASMIRNGDRLLILTEDGSLTLAQATSKQFRTSGEFKVSDGPCWTSPVLSNGRVYCRAATGELTCLNVRLPKEKPQPKERR